MIGLLLGGVLKGQELIESCRTKAIVNDMKAIQAAYNGYIDRYKAIPGDKAAATMTARGWAGTAGAPAGTASNGVLNVTTAERRGAAATEAAAFWRALRGSGLLAGDPTVVALAAFCPATPLSGLLGVTVKCTGRVWSIWNFCLCFGLTKQAAAVDSFINGVLPANNIGNNVGTLRAATNATNPLAPAAVVAAGLAYNETTTTTPLDSS